MSIRIVVDSTADIPKKIAERLTIVPMTITFGEEEFIDRVTIDYQTFYEKLETSDVLPVTSQATPFAFEEIFKSAVDAGDTVIALTISSKLSGTYHSATIAAAEFPGKVHVIDSKSVAMAIGILAEYALSLVDEGLDAETITQKLTEKRDDIRLYAYLDTLEYLKKGGRISKTVAFAGGMLNIKPIVEIADGEVKILAKARGTRQGFSTLTKFIEDAGGINCEYPFLFGYSGTSNEALEKYMSENEDLWADSIIEAEYSQIGSVVGTHAGPGAVALAFFAK